MSTYDLITFGRSNMDLFSANIGAPFIAIEAFTTQVGGSPTNIAIGTARLGMRSAALTAVGADPVGDFVLNYLGKQKVITDLIPRKPGRTSLAVLGIEPPDKFPLTFYREAPPDIELTIDDVPDLNGTAALLMSGTALARGACADAALYALESAQQAGTFVYLDLDLRPDQWPHPMAYGVAMRRIMPLCDVIIGTEEELWAAINRDPAGWHGNAAVSDEERAAVEAWVAQYVSDGQRTVVLKRGARGVSLFVGNDPVVDVSGFPVEVLNTVGAGDAFASGLIFSRYRGTNWTDSARFANACGAIVVTRHGCAEALPTLEEVESFIDRRSR
ncbi:MAG: 5-dehydro-2-deoxygluconokinase [Chloroflexota bacterium]